MNAIDALVPRRINSGPFITAYAHGELKERIRDVKVVLPVCSLGTPVEQLAALGPWVLPPLYHEALTRELQQQLVARIHECFPYYQGSRVRADWKGRVEVVELPRVPLTAPVSRPRVLAFSIDTAVEQHGPHLPLATDTIQSYGVLRRLATELNGFVVGRPLDYGQLTWGLPFGFSIDVTAALLTPYVTGFANAMADWLTPEALYVVDVHGSLIHRQAIQDGLKASRVRKHAFRWLYDPLTDVAADRGDVHAGGVETAIIRTLSPDLVDQRWFPERLDELAAGEMSAQTANELSPKLEQFIHHVESRPLNGIVGKIQNVRDLDGAALLERMLDVARADVRRLVG